MRSTRLLIKEIQGHGDGQEGLARAGRADAEDHVAVLDGLDVAPLVEGLGIDLLAVHLDDMLLEDILLDLLDLALGDQVQAELDVVVLELAVLLVQQDQVLQVLLELARLERRFPST